jgi:sarcosine oxidase delta subunit
MSGHNHNDPCPHCGERPSQSWHYRRGVRVGEKIIARCDGDMSKLAKWREFFLAFRKCAAVSMEFEEFFDGVGATIEGGE